MGKVVQFNLKDSIEYKACTYEVIDKFKVGKDYHYKINCKTCCKKYPKVFNKSNSLILKWSHANRTAFNKETLIICPCHKGYRWKEEDYIHRIETFSNTLVKLKSVGEFKGNLTLCNVHCDVHGGIVVIARHYLKNGGCKSCKLRTVNLDSEAKTTFESKFRDRLIGYGGWEGSSSYYKVLCNCGKEYETKGSSLLEGRECRSCGNSKVKGVTKARIGTTVNNYYIHSVDEDCKARDTKYIVECKSCVKKDPELWYLGSCSSNWGNINGGQKCCGCSKYPTYTNKQVKILVGRLLEGTGYLLQEDIKEPLSKLKLELKCPVGHAYKASYHNFSKGHRCKKCYLLQECTFGLYKNRLEERDTLYLLELDGFLKIGRSFDLTKRLRDYKRMFTNVEVITTYESTHKNIYDIEQRLLTKFSGEQYFHSEHFGGYSECINISQRGNLTMEIQKLI